MKLEKFWVLLKNDLNDEYEVNWCFDLMFVMPLISFKSM